MLRALAAKAIGRNLANPIRANALVGSVVRSLTKDDRLTIRRSVTLARQFRSFDPSRLTTITLPVDRAVQREGVVHRAGQPGFDAGLREGWEQVLLPRQPDADAAVARLLQSPARPGPRAPATTAPPPTVPAPAKVSVTVKNGTSRQGLAARATAARSVARAVKVKPGTRVARADQPGLARNTVVLVLGPDVKGLAGRVAPSKPPASRPPKPTAATRAPPAWDPRPC